MCIVTKSYCHLRVSIYTASDHSLVPLKKCVYAMMKANTIDYVHRIRNNSNTFSM